MKKLLIILCLFSTPFLQSMSKDDLIKKMYQGVEEANLDKLKDVINQVKKEGYDLNQFINIRNKNKETLLHSILLARLKELGDREYKNEEINQDKELIKFFIDKDIDINARDQDGNTPLFYVANIELAKLLIDNGATVDERNASGRTPLLTFVEKYINLAHKDSRDDIEYYSDVYKVMYRDIIEYLIEKGANIYLRSKGGLNAVLLVAIDSMQHPNLVSLFARDKNYKTALIKEMYKSVEKQDLSELKKLAQIAKQYEKYDSSISGYVNATNLTKNDGKGLYSDQNVGKSLLHIAVANNDDDMVQYLIKVGSSQNGTDELGNIPLHYVSTWDMADLLIEYGIENLNIKNKKGETPLYVIAKKYANTGNTRDEDAEYRQIVNLLLRVGANSGVKAEDGKSPDDFIRQKRIIEETINAVMFKIENHIINKNLDGLKKEVEFAEKNGIDVKKIINNVQNLLHNDDYPIIAYLIEKGVEVNKIEKDVEVNKSNIEDDSPFYYNNDFMKKYNNDFMKKMYQSVEESNLDKLKDVVNQAKKEGYDQGIIQDMINAKNRLITETICGLEGFFYGERTFGIYSNDHIGESVLHIAVLNDDYKIAEYLIQNGADVNNRDDNANVPLHIAKSVEMIRLLLNQKNSYVNVNNEEGETSLYIIVNKYIVDPNDTYKGLIQELLMHGANLFSKAKNGESPYTLLSNQGIGLKSLLNEKSLIEQVYWSVKNKSLDELNFFINEAKKKGYNIKKLINAKKDILYQAVQKNDYNITKFLIQNGADVNAQDAAGNVALHAVQNVEIAKMLVDNGAYIDVQNNKKETPLYRMVGNYFRNGVKTLYPAIKYLLMKGADPNLTALDGSSPASIGASFGFIRQQVDNLFDYNEVV